MERFPCLSGELLSAYLDGELTLAERTGARRHLDACPRCAAELATFGRLDAFLAAPAAIDCASALPLLSARHDRELTLPEILVAEAHAVRCVACRAQVAVWGAIDESIGALPVAQPSTRVDAAMLALAARAKKPTDYDHRGLVAGIALRSAVAIVLAITIAVAAVRPQPLQTVVPSEPGVIPPAAAPLPPLGGAATVIVASAQEVVLNPRTNTLYVAHPDEGSVGALDATSLSDIANIVIGGRPTALALNEAANTVLVLDPGKKLLTEIDGSTNTVLGTTSLGVAGTPTTLQVAGGKIVVGMSEPAQSQATAAGAVAVFDSSSKKLESTSTVSVVPRQVVLDPRGQRALLVSEDVVTLVDATTYRPLDQLPGGVAAAFAARGNSTAVLSVAAGGSRVTIAGDVNASLTLLGAPLAIVALPQGGYGILVREVGHSRILEIAADGTPGRSMNVDLAGRELTYNASTRTYAVAGGGGIAIAQVGGAAAPNAPPPAAAAPAPGGTSNPAATPSAPPTAPGAVAPSAPVAVQRQPALPESATLAWAGTYRLDLVNRGAPTVVGRGRSGHMWFVDAANRLTSLDAATGLAYTIAELPRDAHIRSIEVGSSYVYAIDVAASRVYVVALRSEQVSVIQLPFVKSSDAVTVTPDDRLWFAVADQILTLDPLTQKVEAANVGLFTVGAMAADASGRVWFSDEAQKRVAIYDHATHTVTGLALPRLGALVSMVVDATGTLWAGSDAGEIFAIRSGELVSTAALRRPIASLALDEHGAAWFLSADANQASVGRAVSPSAAHTVPASVSGLWFDARGDAWLADRSSAGFFIAVPEAQ